MAHKSGFVNIIGNPNVGKSTLMNEFVGEKLSIITSKAQTTRHRIMGIVSGEDFQIVYSDTPGILKPNYRLQEKMLRFIDLALEDADIILYVTDVKEKYDKNKKYIEKLKRAKIPIILVINKIDLATQEEVESIINQWEMELPDAKILAVSAIKKFNLESVFDQILEKLPESPPFYSKDALTDKPERFFVSEIIREKIFINYKQEIPYSTEVQIEEFKEEDKILNIRANIFVMRKSQRAIILGKQGRAIKKVGIQAREDLESIYDKKVFLDLYVKVNTDWREKEGFLRASGYNN
jgi:GTP-binding protein Era